MGLIEDGSERRRGLSRLMPHELFQRQEEFCRQEARSDRKAIGDKSPYH